MLRRAVDSVLNQTYDNIEIIISDDASNDGTEEFCRNLEKAHGNIKYLRNEVNKGACHSRNKAINNAEGHFITGLDDDDEFNIDRIEFFIDNWNDNYSFVCCNFKEVDTSGNLKSFYKNSEDVVFTYKSLLFENIASNQIFTKLENIKAISGFDERVKRLQDWDTWLRLAHAKGKFKRFNYSTYRMNHDHEINTKRVSRNISLNEAMLALYERNKKLYSEKEGRFMIFNCALITGESKFKECVYWSVKHKKFKYLLKFFYRKIVKFNN